MYSKSAMLAHAAALHSQPNPDTAAQVQRPGGAGPSMGGGGALLGLVVILEAGSEADVQELAGEAVAQGLPGARIVRQPQVASDDVLQQAGRWRG